MIAFAIIPRLLHEKRAIDDRPYTYRNIPPVFRGDVYISFEIILF